MRIVCGEQSTPSKQHVIKPERVLVYSKKMVVIWKALESTLRGVRSLDDIMHIDLHFLCRYGLCLSMLIVNILSVSLSRH